MKKADKELKRWRDKIDRLDKVFIETLARRFLAVKEIGRVKRKFKIPIVQAPRWNHLMRDRVKLAKKNKVSVKLIHQIYGLIQKEAVKIQKTKRR